MNLSQLGNLKLMSNNSKANIKYIPISPKKVNRVASLIRKTTVGEALSLLKVLRVKPAQVLYKAIYSAFCNTNNSDAKSFIFKKILVNSGPQRKRYKPRARGRMYKILKPTAHIYIEIMEDKI